MPDLATASVSAGVSAAVALAVSYLTRRSNNRTAIDGKILKSIELAMSYPHVEDADFCKEWDKPLPPLAADATDEQKNAHAEEKDKRLQYDMYCCFVFNLIEDIWQHCWTRRGISKILHVEEFIETHRCWWDGQRENLFGYSDKFHGYVQSVIKSIKVRETRK